MAGITVKGDLLIDRDVEVTRNLKAEKARYGVLETSATTITLNENSPYRIIVSGTGFKTIILPQTSSSADETYGTGTEFEIISKMSFVQTNKILITDPIAPPGVAFVTIVGGQTMKALCVNGGGAVGSVWDFIFDRKPLISFINFSAWAELPNGNYGFSLEVPSSHPNPIVHFFENGSGDFALLDYTNFVQSSISLEVLPEARFNARVVMT